MNKNIIGISAAILLVLNQFFVCPVEAEDTIFNNGSDSENQITNTTLMEREIFQVNNLKLTSNISIKASTGDNEASGNDGNATIITGNVNILAEALDKGLNNSTNFSSKLNSTGNAKILENGSSSSNSIEEDLSLIEEELSVNDLELNNSINIDSSTGGNKANKNSGKVLISTGDIYLSIILGNSANNSSSRVNKPLKNLLVPLQVYFYVN